MNKWALAIGIKAKVTSSFKKIEGDLDLEKFSSL